MPEDVYANGMSICTDQGSGQAIGFPDVCLTPPPPPAGPIPVPYPNIAMAGDLAAGSKNVKANGGSIALEGDSYLKTSTGDEAGTQGGNVITHKTKGKAFFQAWSFDVHVEGKGVGRHFDPMGLNCGSQPLGGIHPAFLEKLDTAYEGDFLCDEPYDREEVDEGTPTKAQRDMIKGKTCWECGKRPATIADHQPPLVLTYYSGGCENTVAMKSAATTTNDDPENGPCILPHCKTCSEKQRRDMARFSREINKWVQQF